MALPDETKKNIGTVVKYMIIIFVVVPIIIMIIYFIFVYAVVSKQSEKSNMEVAMMKSRMEGYSPTDENGKSQLKLGAKQNSTRAENIAKSLNVPAVPSNLLSQIQPPRPMTKPNFPGVIPMTKKSKEGYSDFDDFRGAQYGKLSNNTSDDVTLNPNFQSKNPFIDFIPNGAEIASPTTGNLYLDQNAANFKAYNPLRVATLGKNKFGSRHDDLPTNDIRQTVVNFEANRKYVSVENLKSTEAIDNYLNAYSAVNYPVIEDNILGQKVNATPMTGPYKFREGKSGQGLVNLNNTKNLTMDDPAAVANMTNVPGQMMNSTMAIGNKTVVIN